MNHLLLKLIRFYQTSRLSKKEAACRFQPTCSQYAFEAIAKYGILKGGLLSLKRIFKCHPWNKGGTDQLV